MSERESEPRAYAQTSAVGGKRRKLIACPPSAFCFFMNVGTIHSYASGGLRCSSIEFF